jgi:hypothetical protein
MFKEKTVFVLGAGASWHYGYPTGERLVEDVIRCTARYQQFCLARLAGGINIAHMPKHIAARATSNSAMAIRAAWQDEVDN